MDKYKIITAKEANKLIKDSRKQRIKNEFEYIEQDIIDASIRGINILYYTFNYTLEPQDEEKIINKLKEYGYSVKTTISNHLIIIEW